jgi:hypothetical protein
MKTNHFLVAAAFAAAFFTAAAASADTVMDFTAEVPAGFANVTLKNTKLGFFNDDGEFTGLCTAMASVKVNVDNTVNFDCDFIGKADASSLVILHSDEFEEPYFTLLQTSNTLYVLSVDGDKMGNIYAFDLDGTEPEFFDYSGTNPVWFDLDGTEPEFFNASGLAWFDLDGTEPEF